MKISSQMHSVTWHGLPCYCILLLYPFAVVLATWLGLASAAEILGNMAPTYFVSVAAIFAAFYAKEAFTNNNG
jgi:hypothetical protein